MAEPLVPSLARARELKINELSTHFANDDLTLDELERRIEQVYKAASVAELETITADLKESARVPVEFVQAKVKRGKGKQATTFELARARLVSLMSSTKRVGRWPVPRTLDVVAIMSDTKLDLTHAVLTDNVTDFEIRVVMASLKIIVPPGMRVVLSASSIMSDIGSRADEIHTDELSIDGGVPATTNTPVLRLTGFALMSDVKVVVRRREEPIAGLDETDDDDDD